MMIVLYIERHKWSVMHTVHPCREAAHFWLVKEGESDLYGSACSCCRSPDDIESSSCDAVGWLHFLKNHRCCAEVPQMILSPFFKSL